MQLVFRVYDLRSRVYIYVYIHTHTIYTYAYVYIDIYIYICVCRMYIYRLPPLPPTCRLSFLLFLASRGLEIRLPLARFYFPCWPGIIYVYMYIYIVGLGHVQGA